MASALARARRGRKSGATETPATDLERERQIIEQDRRRNDAAIRSAKREVKRLREATTRSTEVIERAQNGD